MKPNKICEKDVLRGLKMVVPKLARINLDKFDKNIGNVAKFLIKVKGNRRKWFLTMSVDYFNCLLTYYQATLKLEGFRISHIDTTLAKDLYIKFLEERGSLYWNGIIGDTQITTDSGVIYSNIDAPNIETEKVKTKLKEKFGKGG